MVLNPGSSSRRVDRPGFYLEPTIITDIEPKNPLFSQEAFGPVASVCVVDTEDEAVALANAKPFGPGSAVFSGNVDHARQVAGRIESGVGFLNQPARSLPEVPIRGSKQSWRGRGRPTAAAATPWAPGPVLVGAGGGEAERGGATLCRRRLCRSRQPGRARRPGGRHGKPRQHRTSRRRPEWLRQGP